MQKYNIFKKRNVIAEIDIHSSCLEGDPKIDALIKDITFGEITTIGDLTNTLTIESQNYRIERTGHFPAMVRYAVVKKETVILPKVN